MTTTPLEGETILVTGGGSSVGRAIAERCLAAGAKVHICDINGDAVQATLEDNPGLRGTTGSVGTPDDVDRIICEATEWMGPLSVLVNVVGIAGPKAAIEDISLDDWRESMTINLDGMFLCIQKVVPAMKEQRKGAIINFSSGSTRTGLPLRTPYVVSKYAVEGLTKNLARELGPHNIRVNAILPGMIENEHMRIILERNAAEEGVSAEEIKSRYLQYISMRSGIAPDELAEMTAFLIGPGGKHVTGQLIGVCGNVEWEI